jgi:hypothetical protein
VRTQVVVRIRDDWVFYHDPPPHALGTTGRSAGTAPHSRSPTRPPGRAPNVAEVTDDPAFGRIEVTAWAGLNPRAPEPRPLDRCQATPIVTGTIIGVHVQHLPNRRAGEEHAVAVAGRPVRLDL